MQKIQEADPLIGPNCQGGMRITAFIEDDRVIKKMLKHLGLWDTRNHDPPARTPAHILDSKKNAPIVRGIAAERFE